MAATALRPPPLRKSRLDIVVAPRSIAAASMTGRAWRPVDDLEHPHEEAVAADDTDGDDGPNAERQDEERDQLAAPTSFRHRWR